MTRLSIDQLGLAPELAVLTILETVADATILAPAAAYPELQDFYDPADYSQTTLAARAVIDHARAMRGAIMRYRKTTLRLLHQNDHTLPF
jgi:hypothetical protein